MDRGKGCIDKVCTSHLITRNDHAEQLCAYDVVTRVLAALTRLVSQGTHWSGEGIRNTCSAEPVGQLLPQAPLSVGCVRTPVDMAPHPIRITDTGGCYTCDVPQSQLFGGVSRLITSSRTVYMTAGLSRWPVSVPSRLYKDEYVGLMCPCHTSMGASAGCTRMLVAHVRVRICNDVTLCFIRELREVIDCHECDDDCVTNRQMVLVGHPMMVCDHIVNELIRVYHGTCASHHTPTVHITEDGTHVVSVNTGALMGYVKGLGWVDSIMGVAGRRQVWNTTSIELHDVTNETTFFSSQTCMVPFLGSLPAARRALSGHFLNHALSWPYNSVSHKMVPLYREDPLVVSSHAQEV